MNLESGFMEWPTNMVVFPVHGGNKMGVDEGKVL